MLRKINLFLAIIATLFISNTIFAQQIVAPSDFAGYRQLFYQ